MPLSAFNKWARSRRCRAHGQDTHVPLVPSRQQLPEHTCDARCPARQGRGAAKCSRDMATTLGGSVGRSGFLRGLGTLVGATALGGAVGPLGALFSPVAKALAAGKSKRAALGAGLWLGNARGLTPAQALTYTDPGSGDPALLLRLANGRYVSFDAGCTHGTCTVAYDTRRRLMVCPCHGATFDPAHSAAVGPAKDPLYQLPIRVDASGDVYYLDAPPGPRTNRLKKAPPYTGQTGDDGGDGEGSNGQSSEGGDTQTRQLSRSTSTRRTISRLGE
jgi:Rieske Fe-S protein